MKQDVKIVAAVQGGSSTQVQDLFRDLVARLRPGTRIAGVIEEDHGLGKRACSAGRLQSIVDGRSYPIFQDIGPDSDACHLDGSGAISASQAVCNDIAAGCDLVLLSKFGKLESSGGGLAPAFAAAVEAGVPVLTAVSPSFQAAWARFAAPFSVALPADPVRIQNWWRSVCASRAVAQATHLPAR